MKPFNVKAMVVLMAIKFVLSDIVGRVIFSLLLSSGFMAFLGIWVQTPLGMLNLYSVLFLGTDLLVNIAAGYLAAFWAPDRRILHGVVLGFLCLGFSLFTFPPSEEAGLPLWSHFSRYLVVPEILLGSWLLVKMQAAKVSRQNAAVAPIASPLGD